MNVKSQCCRKRRHSVARLAVCQFLQGLSPAFAMMTAWPASSGKHSLRIDVAQSAVILVAPVIPRSSPGHPPVIPRSSPGHPPVIPRSSPGQPRSRMLVSRRRIGRSPRDALLQNCQSSLGKWSALFCRLSHQTVPGVTMHMIVRSFCF